VIVLKCNTLVRYGTPRSLNCYNPLPVKSKTGSVVISSGYREECLGDQEVNVRIPLQVYVVFDCEYNVDVVDRYAWDMYLMYSRDNFDTSQSQQIKFLAKLQLSDNTCRLFEKK